MEFQLISGRILPEDGLPGCSDAFREDGNRQHESRIAKLFASKGAELPGAIIDARCARVTIAELRVKASGRKHGGPIMRFALNRRNLSITEEAGNSSRMASREGSDS